MSELIKDPMILTKSVKRGKDKKDREMLSISINPEQALIMIDAATSALERGKDRGIKFQFHLSKAQTENGREFDSCFFFVKDIQEFGAAQAKKPIQSDELKARIEKTKQSIAASTKS